jgi:hypothetical protein
MAARLNLGFRVGTSSSRVTKYSVPRSGPHYVLVGAHDRVLVLEDLLPRILKFREWLGSSAKIVNTVPKAIQELQQRTFDVVMIDRDLASPTDGHGEDLGAYLNEIAFAGRVIVHSTNPFGVELIKKTLGGITPEIAPFDVLGVFREK